MAHDHCGHFANLITVHGPTLEISCFVGHIAPDLLIGVDKGQRILSFPILPMLLIWVYLKDRATFNAVSMTSCLCSMSVFIPQEKNLKWILLCEDTGKSINISVNFLPPFREVYPV